MSTTHQTTAPRRHRIVPTSASNGYSADGRWLLQYWDPEVKVWFDRGIPHASRERAATALWALATETGEELWQHVEVDGVVYQLEVAGSESHPQWHYHDDPHQDGTPGQPQHHHHGPTCEHRTALLVPLYPERVQADLDHPTQYRRNVGGERLYTTPEEETAPVLVPDGGPCPDCAVPVGARHDDGCDVAPCKGCGRQALQCDEHQHLPMTVWTGEWPGERECRELGLFITHESVQHPPFVKTTGDDPDATGDLNELARWGFTGKVVWNPERERWVRP